MQTGLLRSGFLPDSSSNAKKTPRKDDFQRPLVRFFLPEHEGHDEPCCPGCSKVHKEPRKGEVNLARFNFGPTVTFMGG
jgi:hypothetical protein